MNNKLQPQPMVIFETVPNMVTLHKDNRSYNNALVRNGQIFYNKDGSQIKILEYINAHNIIAVFTETGYNIRTRYDHLKEGILRDPFRRSVFGIGYIGVGPYLIKNEIGNTSKSYNCWNGLLRRCYDTTSKDNHPTYYGIVHVDEIWLCYQTFCMWYYSNIYELEDEVVCLDKDLLSNYKRIPKIYGPDTCCFLPTTINIALQMEQITSGKYSVGVQKIEDDKYDYKKPYRSVMGTIYGSRFLGRFETEQEARNTYIDAKKRYLKELADKYKKVLAPIAYEALYNYNIY